MSDHFHFLRLEIICFTTAGYMLYRTRLLTPVKPEVCLPFWKADLCRWLLWSHVVPQTQHHLKTSKEDLFQRKWSSNKNSNFSLLIANVNYFLLFCLAALDIKVNLAQAKVGFEWFEPVGKATVDKIGHVTIHFSGVIHFTYFRKNLRNRGP